jgi:arsenite-transporting ATPase
MLADQSGGMGSMMQDLAFAIPGVDEAMGFAEIMKSVVALYLRVHADIPDMLNLWNSP